MERFEWDLQIEWKGRGRGREGVSSNEVWLMN